MTRLGVLTSGGDAPAMNAAIAGVCEAAAGTGAEVVGFRRGFRGLAAGDGAAIGRAQAGAHLHLAGTWLGSSRHPEMRTPEGLTGVARGLTTSGVDGLVIIGGGGSLDGARALGAAGCRVAFLPATIDNDIAESETTIGIDSAVNYAVTAIAQLRITGRALEGRAFVVETLGGDTDHLARAVAAAADVEDVLRTGEPDELERVAANLRDLADAGEAIAVMPEGIGHAVGIAAALQRLTGLRVHPTILGHAQRAARPTARDLALALAAGRLAATELVAGHSVFVALRGDEARSEPLVRR